MDEVSIWDRMRQMRNSQRKGEAVSELVDPIEAIYGAVMTLITQGVATSPYRVSHAKKTVTLAATLKEKQTVLICPANPNRKAYTIFNDSTTALAIGIEADISSGNQIDQLGSNGTIDSISKNWGLVCYTGALYGRRSSGNGGAVVWEFE